MANKDIQTDKSVTSSKGMVRIREYEENGYTMVEISFYTAPGPRGGTGQLKASQKIERGLFLDMLEILWPGEVAYQFKDQS